MIDKLSLDDTDMTPEELEVLFGVLKMDYEIHLKAYNVSFPKRDSIKLLWLIFLKKHEGKLIHKDTISAFVNKIKPKSGKDQQVRHLASDGWYVLNKGDKLMNEDSTVPSGYHVLITTESPKPSFLWKSMKRAGRISAQNFEQLKITYDLRCATCGSQEGKPHFLEQNLRTKLQQGHLNPHKKLTLENSIPQCQLCNQAYKDDFVFNEKGRVLAVASIRPVLKADPEVQEEIKKALNINSGQPGF